ncbi:MAG: IgA Peptidase M64, partial [Thermoanaerobaculia bacterium]|nr:IgA Peptidase M64 [Thermoanaerobaculia bacterium]
MRKPPSTRPRHRVRPLSLILILAFALPALNAAQTPDAMATRIFPFEGHFENKTLRLDFFHTGGMGTEIFALDQALSDGPWTGSTTQLFDDTNLGAYLFQVIDPKVDAVLYSRGFASIYGEWVTTPEAKETHRTFHESLRFPWPKHPVRVVLHARDENLRFQKVWSVEIDPSSRFVNPADRAPAGKVWAVHESGPPQQKVDLLLLPEGYTAEEMDKFHADAKRLVAALFKWDPFKSRKGDFNVWAIDLPTAESGGNRPRAKHFRRTALSASYNTFDSERYVLTYDNRALRDIASGAPYEFLEILVNDAQYGGGGIFNNQATTSVDTGFAEYVFVHEFGHHFAGLGDEYYTSPVSYATSGSETPREPWSPN